MTNQTKLSNSGLTNFEAAKALLTPPWKFFILTEKHCTVRYECYQLKPNVRSILRLNRANSIDYSLNLYGDALLITVFRRGSQVPAFGPTPVPFTALESLKFYYHGPPRVRLLFKENSNQLNGRLLPEQPSFLLFNLSRKLKLTFRDDRQRIQLLSMMKITRLLDFSVSPLPAKGGFTIGFHANAPLRGIDYFLMPWEKFYLPEQVKEGDEDGGDKRSVSLNM